MMAAYAFDPWLADPPPFDAYLPGGVCDVTVTPAPARRLGWRDVTAIHGMLSGLLNEVGGIAHHERLPRFSILPASTAFGWAAYFDSHEAIAALAQQVHPGRLRDQLVAVRFGLVRRVRSPLVSWRGRRTLHVEALSPVLVRRTCKPNGINGIEKEFSAIHETPTSENLRSAITQSFAPRLGLPPGSVANAIVELVAHDVGPAGLRLGGKYGTPKGWAGSIIAHVNAPAAALFRAAETTGLGGRTAFGFGRIVVRDA